ncbi:MAG: putative manganese-dependent inorganic diphosphatase [Candidatus Woesearchaeota archaeon]
MCRNFVVGHKNPDLDSIASSIVYAYFKSETTNEEFKAVAQGLPNNETKYVLKELNLDYPEIKTDIFLRVSDIMVNPITIRDNLTFQETLDYFFNYHLKSMPVVDENNEYLGIINIDFLSRAVVKNFYTNELNYLEISYDKLKSVLMPAFDYKKEPIVKGEINLASDLDIEKPAFGIVIVSADSKRLPILFSSPIQTLIISNANDPNVFNHRAYPFNLFVTSRRTQEVIQMLHLQQSIKNFIKTDAMFLNEDDLVSEVKEKVIRKQFVVPVLRDNRVVGVVGKKEIYSNKVFNLILVDHNTFAQSIDGIENANILEIIDHHNLGDIYTMKPIEVTLKPVGSTATLIYQKFKDSNLSIPDKLAKLLLYAILSDTIILTSPTTTKEDIDVVKEISNMINVDYNELGRSLFSANEEIVNDSIIKLFTYDYKEQKIYQYKVGIGQLQLVNVDKVLARKNEILEAINYFVNEKLLDVFVFVVTDILKNNSYLFTNKPSLFSKYMDNENNILVPFISRKKEIIPYLFNALKNKK